MKRIFSIFSLMVFLICSLMPVAMAAEEATAVALTYDNYIIDNILYEADFSKENYLTADANHVNAQTGDGSVTATANGLVISRNAGAAASANMTIVDFLLNPKGQYTSFDEGKVNNATAATGVVGIEYTVSWSQSSTSNAFIQIRQGNSYNALTQQSFKWGNTLRSSHSAGNADVKVENKVNVKIITNGSTTASNQPYTLYIDDVNVGSFNANGSIAGVGFVRFYITGTAAETLTIHDFKTYTMTEIPAELKAAHAGLTEETIKGENASLSKVTTNLSLPTTIDGYDGVTVSWSSDDSSIAANGTVTRPEDENAQGVLTAQISNGNDTIYKSFDYNVLATTSYVTDYNVSGNVITAIFYNNTKNALTAPFVIAALYNKTAMALEEVSKCEIGSTNIGDVATLTFDFEKATNVSGYNYRIFVWENGTLIPITK